MHKTLCAMQRDSSVFISNATKRIITTGFLVCCRPGVAVSFRRIDLFS